MARIIDWFNTADKTVTRWMARYAVLILRISVGIVFFWFGFIKFFPGLSPAEEIAGRTIETLSFGLIQPQLSLPILAAWESLIGLGLITGRFKRATLFLLFLQMIGTTMPIFIFPAETWKVFPIAPTLEGQYIIKNMVLISAGLVIGATVRGGDMVADEDLADEADHRFQHQARNPD
ncbi:DoxX family membrane protein [Phototrophicus methaneseepsis]|uniref:DoxX family membrane protein n=1 Tax=Phototrophicus methaneseepsis TaxID=2710758 RepID=A0A7S8E8M8_9CHLR|nr:DoxX family membrane protein [Phototrophicus methaneseepsis]QPC82402.1 DoxX family membrane protein [Phototrophicus methaneseepsis]